MAFLQRYASSAGAGLIDGTSEANAWDWATMLTDANPGTTGVIINFKGNHTLLADATFTNSGSAAAQLRLRGYATTIGDGYQGRTNGNGALVTTNMPVISGNFRLLNTAKTNVSLENIVVSNTLNSEQADFGARGMAFRCKFVNASTGTSARNIISAASDMTICDCDLEITAGGVGSRCISITSVNARVLFNRITNGGAASCTGTYFGTGAARVYFIGNVTYACTGTGLALDVAAASAAAVIQNTFDECGVAIALANDVNSNQNPAIINNIFMDCTDAIKNLYVTADVPLFAVNNAFFNCDDYDGWVNYIGYGDVALADDPFVDSANRDYRLKESALAKGAGIVPHMDIGALQRQEVFTPIFVRKTIHV